MLFRSRTILARHDTSAGPIRCMLGDLHLALMRADGAQLREEPAREGVGGDDNAPRDDGALIGHDPMAIRRLRDDPAHCHSRVQLHSGPERTLQQPHTYLNG